MVGIDHVPAGKGEMEERGVIWSLVLDFGVVWGSLIGLRLPRVGFVWCLRWG